MHDLMLGHTVVIPVVIFSGMTAMLVIANAMVVVLAHLLVTSTIIAFIAIGATPLDTAAGVRTVAIIVPASMILAMPLCLFESVTIV